MLANNQLTKEVAAFIKDLGVGGDNHQQAIKSLGKLLATLHKVHFMIGADKIWVGYTSIDFLGYCL